MFSRFLTSMKLPEVRASILCRLFSTHTGTHTSPLSPSLTWADSIATSVCVCVSLFLSLSFSVILLFSLSSIRSPCHHECHGQQQRRQRQRQQQHDRGQDECARQQCSSAERDRQAEQLRAQDEHDAGGGGYLGRYGSWCDKDRTPALSASSASRRRFGFTVRGKGSFTKCYRVDRSKDHHYPYELE